jgi:molecular chaperone HscA
VKPQYGLTDAEVERMLLDSIDHAKEDMHQRALIEAQTEAQVLLETTRNFLLKNETFLTIEEITGTKETIQKLEGKLRYGSKDEVQQVVEELNTISKPYAERLMNESVKKALKNKSIS